MTEWYTHFDPNEFGEIRRAQEALLRPDHKKAADTGKARKKTGKPQKAERKAKVLLFPKTGTAQGRRKRA
jgi:hypothetical protein